MQARLDHSFVTLARGVVPSVAVLVEHAIHPRSCSDGPLKSPAHVLRDTILLTTLLASQMSRKQLWSGCVDIVAPICARRDTSLSGGRLLRTMSMPGSTVSGE